MVKKFWHHVSKRRKKQFWLLLTLMLFGSFAEIISVGSVLPFLGALTAPETIYQHPFMQPFIQSLQITEPSQLLFPLTISFMAAVLVAISTRLALLYVTTRLSYAIGADLSISIYRRTLYQDYSVHLSRNSSEVINGIISKTQTATAVINAFLLLASSSIIIISIVITLFIIDTVVAISLFIGFGAIYKIISYYTKQQLQSNSECVAIQSNNMVQSLQEGLGGIRDVLLDGSQQFYCNLYRSADLPMRRAKVSTTFIAHSPRYLIEGIGILLITGLAYIMSLRPDGAITSLPILGALALGAQRILPALQQAYGSYSNIKGEITSFQDVIQLLEQPLPSWIDQPLSEPLPFEKEIQLKNISFRYGSCENEDTPWILKNINLKLTKGSRIGFIGETGSGKSTLIDIIMGLLDPTSGKLIIDEQTIDGKNKREWQAHIAHVPQSIYLSDNTIEENIAFGVPKNEIDHQKVEEAAKQAQILELIEGWKDGYQTFVGERGVRLSGGQRQRIGIARALYKQANILILDEATSALDNETEQAVMDSIEVLGRDLTILIIAHRITTLKVCDKVVKLDKDHIMRTGSYQEIVNV